MHTAMDIDIAVKNYIKQSESYGDHMVLGMLLAAIHFALRK